MKILVALQYDQFFPQCIFDAIFDSPSSYRWGIRLHPTMAHLSQPFYEVLLDKGLNNVEVYHSTSTDFYDLYDDFNCLVTPWSSLAIEAINLEMTTIITPGKIGHDMFGIYQQDPSLLLASDYEDFIEKLKIIDEKPPHLNKKLSRVKASQKIKTQLNRELSKLKPQFNETNSAKHFIDNLDIYNSNLLVNKNNKSLKKIVHKMINFLFGKYSNSIIKLLKLF